MLMIRTKAAMHTAFAWSWRLPSCSFRNASRRSKISSRLLAPMMQTSTPYPLTCPCFPALLIPEGRVDGAPGCRRTMSQERPCNFSSQPASGIFGCEACPAGAAVTTFERNMTTLSGILEWPAGAEGRIRQLDDCLLEQQTDPFVPIELGQKYPLRQGQRLTVHVVERKLRRRRGKKPRAPRPVVEEVLQ